jgi:hypothetical protein
MAAISLSGSHAMKPKKRPPKLIKGSRVASGSDLSAPLMLRSRADRNIASGRKTSGRNGRLRRGEFTKGNRGPKWLSISDSV